MTMNLKFPTYSLQTTTTQTHVNQQPRQYPYCQKTNDDMYECMICYDYSNNIPWKTHEHIIECIKIQEERKKQKEKLDQKMIQFLKEQIERNTRDIENLKNIISQMRNQEKRKINIAEWLNNHCSFPQPSVDFQTWRKSEVFIPTSKELQMVFEQNIKIGIQHVLEKVIQQNNNIPIRAFSKEKNVFYIFEKMEVETPQPIQIICKWRKIKNNEIFRWFEVIQHKFFLKFTEWEEENGTEFFELEENKQKQIKYCQKINQELHQVQPQSIRNWLWDSIKINLKCTIELEFDVDDLRK